MLTIALLNKFEPKTIIDSGIIQESTFVPPVGHPTRPLKWVAVIGGGHDWAIYYQDSEIDERTIAKQGIKLHCIDLIKNLMPCTEAALKRYRL